jgi:hypothetical protein
MPLPRGLEIFRGRRLAPLISAWIGGGIVAVILFWIDRAQPAFHDILLPIYGVVLVIVGIPTWHWIRARQGNRRGRERRKEDRRDTGNHPVP